MTGATATTTAATNKPSTLDEVIQHFNAAEIHVARAFNEGSGSQIAFYENGDTEVGFKAVKLCRTLGLSPFELRHVWSYVVDEGEHPYWELLFLYEEPEVVSFEEAGLHVSPEGAVTILAQ